MCAIMERYQLDGGKPVVEGGSNEDTAVGLFGSGAAVDHLILRN